LHPVDLSDDQKNRKGNDDEVQNGIDKNAIIQSRCTGGFGSGDTRILFPERLIKRFEKSTLPSATPIGGMRMSSTNDVTILPNAAESPQPPPDPLHSLFE
jgi:hypothetical protein